MILFKACPRCTGDLKLESDMYGPYAQCLQCGHIADFKDENAAAKFVAATFLGMLPLTFFYTSFGSAVLENRLITWLGGVTMVVLFFLLPRWIERYDLFGLKRYFAHEESPDDDEK